MNCHQAAKRMIDLFDVEKPGMEPLAEHLQNCPECRLRFCEERRAFDTLRPVQRIVASQQFKGKVMNAIVVEARRESVQSERRWNRGWPRWVAVGCAAALLLLVLPMLPFGRGGSQAAGLKLLAQSLEAMSNLETVHVIGRMRTLPGDNFELIGTKYEFVPLELWREYGNPSRWRVEKTGRVVVMDGQSSLLYIPGANAAMRGTPQSGFVEWLRPLLNPKNILQSELDAAQKGVVETRLAESRGVLTLSARRKARVESTPRSGSVEWLHPLFSPENTLHLESDATQKSPAEAALAEPDGVLTLTTHQKARGDFANSWAKNQSIEESDHTCIYKFDASSKRLEGLQVLINENGGQTSVLELTDFRYNETFPSNLFGLQLPSGVNWILEPAAMPPSSVTLNSPRETAEYFFDALAHEDWEAVLEVEPASRVDDRIKGYYGGLKVVSIGKAFKSGLYRGYFVPYEIQLRNGSTIKQKLAVRNDNPAGRWIVDGGW